MSLVRVSKDGCWEWQGRKTIDGYGRFNYGGRVYAAHRAMLLFVTRAIPDGLETDHLCRNPGCVSPFHLEVVDHLTNMARSLKATKTHCAHGHPLSGENLYRRPTRPRARECKTCKAAATAAHNATPEGKAKMRGYQREWWRRHHGKPCLPLFEEAR